MSSSSKLIKEETYKGFDIMHYINGGNCKWNTEYYAIYRDGYQFSSIALCSTKAAKTVIDTYLKNKTKPVYK